MVLQLGSNFNFQQLIVAERDTPIMLYSVQLNLDTNIQITLHPHTGLI